MEQKDPWWGRDPQRARARSWTWKSTGVLAVVAGIVVIGLGAVIVGPQRPMVEDWDYGTQTRASIDALAAGCGPTYTVTDPLFLQRRVGTVPDTDQNGDPVALAWISAVPFVGGMYETGVDTGTRTVWLPEDADPPRLEAVMRSLWDGWMVVYYTRDADKAQVDRLAAFAHDNPADKILVMPYPKDRAEMPKKAKFGFAAWNAVQECRGFLTNQAREFRELHPVAAAPGADGTIPRALTFEETHLEVLNPHPIATGEATVGANTSPAPADSPSESPASTASPSPTATETQ